MDFTYDALVFRPDDVDLRRSPLRSSLDEPTYVLGAFNPGLARLPNGDLLIMVRVAEALSEPVKDGFVRAIRWTPDGYRLDPRLLQDVDMTDPRQFYLRRPGPPQLGLTSLSWLLPVRLSPDGKEVREVMYDHAIAPTQSYQEYGVEDARITKVDDTYWMTSCTVGAERHATSMHTSKDGLTWELQGLVLDHQNKDMLLFEGKVSGKFMALTRPLGQIYLAYPEDSPWQGGPSINIATSPDGLHWRPLDRPGIRARRGSTSAGKIGGGAQPVLTDAGWLVVYHGVEPRGIVGAYRTFWAVLDKDDPTKILRLEDEVPLMEHNPALTAPIAHQQYLASPVVFTTGLADGGDVWIAASGEADLACRITHLPKKWFA